MSWGIEKEMDRKELKNFVKTMRKLGIISLTLDGMHIELGPEPVKTPRASKGSPQMSPEGLKDALPGEVSEDDLLFWSAGIS
jgi:hypothetical protein